MKSAPGVQVASKQLIRHATSNCPAINQRWRIGRDGTHCIKIGEWEISLLAQGKWWFILRTSADLCLGLETLAFFSFGSAPAPICTDNLEGAKKLAVYYHFLPVEKAGGIVWKDPDDE